METVSLQEDQLDQLLAATGPLSRQRHCPLLHSNDSNQRQENITQTEIP